MNFILGCEFDGKIYKSGDTLPGVCARIICMNGKWNATGHIHECCKFSCFLKNILK